MRPPHVVRVARAGPGAARDLAVDCPTSRWNAATTASVLLEHLRGVRQTGTGRWIACCPAHDDKHPSLAVRELDDGRVLVHDFAGCCTADVLAAVGLDFDALYSRAVDHRVRPERRPFPAADVLRAIEYEALIAATAASFLANGGTLTDDDRARLRLAAERITAAVQESRYA